MQICAAQRAGALRRPHAESASHLVAGLRHTSFVKKVVLCRCLHVNVSKSPTSNAATEVAIRLDRSRGRHESVLRNMGAAGSVRGDTIPKFSARLCFSRRPNSHPNMACTPTDTTPSAYLIPGCIPFRSFALRAQARFDRKLSHHPTHWRGRRGWDVAGMSREGAWVGRNSSRRREFSELGEWWDG